MFDVDAMIKTVLGAVLAIIIIGVAAGYIFGRFFSA